MVFSGATARNTGNENKIFFFARISLFFVFVSFFSSGCFYRGARADGTSSSLAIWCFRFRFTFTFLFTNITQERSLGLGGGMSRVS